MSSGALEGEPGKGARPKEPRRWPTLGSTVPLITGLAAITGGAVYAIMRYSYQEFYNAFGLTPDDVGPSSAGALTQSGAGVAAFVFLFALLPFALALLASIGVGRILGVEKAAGLRAVAAVAIPAVAAVGVYRLYSHFTRGHLEWPQLAVIAIAALLLASRSHLGERLPYPPTAWFIAVAAIAVGANALWASLPYDATRTARCALAFPNEPVRFVHTHRRFLWLDHMSVIRVRADPVRVEELNGQRPPWLPTGDLLYLGDAGGRDFIYAESRRSTLQIPDGSVLVLTTPHEQHCHWWEHHL